MTFDMTDCAIARNPLSSNHITAAIGMCRT
jgi:hypothetical protein